MRLSDSPIEPIRKTRVVPLGRPDAFELFTSSMGVWWPLATHSIAGDDATGVRFEGRVGGRVVELTATGDEHHWADVIAWDPPHRFALAWHPSPDPEVATIVDVRFFEGESHDQPGPGTGTRIELVHRAWEELGADPGRAGRADYDPGWDGVLGHLTSEAGDVTAH